MKTSKPPKKIKHVELWLRDDNVLYIVDPNDGILICYVNGRYLEEGPGEILPWGDWFRIRGRYSKTSFFNFEFIGEFK